MTIPEIIRSINQYEDITFSFEEPYGEDGNVWYPFKMNGLEAEIAYEHSYNPKNDYKQKGMFEWLIDEVFNNMDLPESNNIEFIKIESARLKALWVTDRNPDWYYPLPECLEIKSSSLHGSGLFATDGIPAGTDLGLSHKHYGWGGIDRTPLGGFYNHSDTPNTKRVMTWTGNYGKAEQNMGNVYHHSHLITEKDIKYGEEITVNYELYKPHHVSKTNV
jgi:hypothetical protein